ncbi:MAG: RNA polymerase subunit sigma-70 [Blautia sp.]|nr:RNA polymerase subunit sigma-70 [Blautia sp.]
MDKRILYDYIDACELIKETEAEIRKLQKKKKMIVRTSVSGSNPEFPYNPQHFEIEGTAFTYKDDSDLREEEKILEERKKNAEKIKLEVERWMNTIPNRMQRIIEYKIFKELTWQQVAQKIGRKSSENGIKKEFERFMKEK